MCVVGYVPRVHLLHDSCCHTWVILPNTKVPVTPVAFEREYLSGQVLASGHFTIKIDVPTRTAL